MTLSIWRYSHFLLALTSALFLIIASFTGIILAFEPMQSAVAPYRVSNNGIPVSETIKALGSTYEEVLFLEVDANDLVIANVITKTGDNETIYIDPKTAEKLGVPKTQAPIFKLATTLHRSLFLKSIGRIFMGTISFFLCLIAITGLLLIIRRQGGLINLFSKVQKDYFELRYHVILGRWLLLPIIIIAATGTYLSAEKFSLLPSGALDHNTIEQKTDVDQSVEPWDLPIFKTILLKDVRTISFPFSEEPEDYFEISLHDKEIYIHQYTGGIISEAAYPFVVFASRWSMALHTGQGSLLWSVILLSASISILFFIYSGFVMWRKRLKNTKTLRTMANANKDECSHIILVGSETGTTLGFAKLLEEALAKAGKTVFIDELNSYTTYKKATHLIIFAATYGEGDAPTNARKFERLFTSIAPLSTMQYSVVGFGSLIYPAYCAFAVKVQDLLQNSAYFKETLPIHSINDRDERAFRDWTKKWGDRTDTPVSIDVEKKKKRISKQIRFKVVARTAPNKDNTFLVRLRPQEEIRFQSGDLAGIIPYKNAAERLYSIAKMDNDILLSVKKHAFGACSSFLSQLEVESSVHLNIRKNQEFHFPEQATSVVFIANGTGIAPFLGMLLENRKKIPVHLFIGLRTKNSLNLYNDILSKAIEDGFLTTLNIAYSKEEEKKYVQDLIPGNVKLISGTLENGGSVLICGSLAMQNSVLDELERIALNVLLRPLSDLENKEQLKMDCY